MKKIISFSLWGRLPKYWVGAQRNIELAATYYPGWICRFYVDATLQHELAPTLIGDNVEVELTPPRPDCGGLFWRFLAAADPGVEIMVSRDCDSRIGPREAAAVSAWLDSGKPFHIMRDHPWHLRPILGGMWGYRNGTIPEMRELITQWPDIHRKGIDQDFLAASIHPLVRGRALEHSEFGIEFGAPTVPFPTPRTDYEFVGEIFFEDGSRHEKHRELIKEAIGEPAIAARPPPGAS